MFRKLIRLEKPFDFLKDAGGWFVSVLALSLLVRLWLVLFTEGTYDVEIWRHHAEEIQRIGLTGYYNASFGDIRQYNHPPVMGHIASLCLLLSARLRIPFKILFRLPFALQDFLIAFYLMRILRASVYRYVCTAFYLLCPLTFILSSYHGNTDSSLALFGLACLYYFSLGKYALAGVILGAGTWVKWIAALLAPVMLFSAPGARKKARFLVWFGVASIAGYLWALAHAPYAVIRNVFGYGGQMIQTTAGVPVWGIRVLYAYAADAYLKLFSYPTRAHFFGWLVTYIANNSVIVFAAVVAYAWLRRRRRTPAEIARTIGGAYCIFYAVTNFWSFQHFAWAIPFWLFLDAPLALAIFFLTTLYIYSLYSLVCGSYLLLGRWDFLGHPYLSGFVLFSRDACITLFVACAIYLFYREIGNRENRGRSP